MNKKNIAFIKFLIFLTSLVFSLIALEFGLRIFLSKYGPNQVYRANNESINQDFKYELFHSTNKNMEYEVLAFGDSYTNGGNLNWENTYPHQLYKALGSNVTVRNMGACEDTTKGVYTRLSRFIDSEEFSQSKKYFIVILIGAADIFVTHDKYYQDRFSKSWLNDKESPWINLKGKIQEEDSWLESLKTVKMVSYIISRINEVINTQVKSTIDSKFISALEEIKKCYVLTPDKKLKCATPFFRSLDFSNQGKHQGKEIIEHFEKIVYSQYPLKMNRNQIIIEDLLYFIKLEPDLIQQDSILYNLVSYTLMQSTIPTEFISAFLTKAKERVPKADKLVSNIIFSINRWQENTGKIKELRSTYWNKIIQITDKNNITLISANYPLPFVEVNSQLKEIAKKNKINFVDLNNIFNIKIKSSNINDYIDDWEHCTAKGYKLMATEIKKYIN